MMNKLRSSSRDFYASLSHNKTANFCLQRYEKHNGICIVEAKIIAIGRYTSDAINCMNSVMTPKPKGRNTFRKKQQIIEAEN